MRATEKPVEILLVEDNPADVQLIMMLLRSSVLPHKLTTVRDGEAATDYLFKRVKEENAPRPDLIILDLNLPKKDGRVVLAEFKQNPETCGIPILIFTTSHNQADICRCYELHANCYITKPSDLEKFNSIMKSIEQFWLSTVELPRCKVVGAEG